MWSKESNFELAVKVPLMVRVPSLAVGHGASTTALAELLDIYPTLADIAGPLLRLL